MEFPGAVKSRGIEINVIVNVALVGMGADEKLVFAFRPAHRRFKAQLICLLRRHLAGRERLPYLEEQRPALHGPGLQCPRLGIGPVLPIQGNEWKPVKWMQDKTKQSHTNKCSRRNGKVK